MHNDFNWEDLGGRIEDVVNRAVNSRDFDKLNQTIRQVVDSAVGAGGEAVRKAAKSVQTAQTQNTNRTVALRKLYGSTGGIIARGVLQVVFGSLIGIPFLVMTVIALLADFGIGALGTFLMGLGGSVLLGWRGIWNLCLSSRFNAYRRLLGNRTTCALEKLARVVGKSAEFVRKDLGRMFGKGLFLEGHLDHEKTMLITSDETYREFEQARRQLEAVRKQQAAEAASAPDPRVKEVLDKGNAFIRDLIRCNDAIPGEEVSAKISHMELIVRRIFDRVREHPEAVPDLKKMMDYYLPMTVKLLNAYADMDAQPVQGGTIESSKREIEGTLDTLNRAFEKLLDELFQDTALDVSTDITVLQTMLAQEGLTDDALTNMRKNSQ